MTDPIVEERVASFLDGREEEPGLTPDAFAARFPEEGRPALLKAIGATLAALALFPDPVDVPGLKNQRQRIGPYQVMHEIGRGGMGVVYEVDRDGERFALKFLPMAPLLGTRALERFRREKEILHRLCHPGIVKIVDSGLDDEIPFIVMELVAGEPLTGFAGRFSFEESARFVRSLALAVQAVHDEGVCHRDLKPQNVLVRKDGTPVLLDFGLMAADDLASLTSTGDMLGTPRYMAPEQARGLEADVRTDVHALGLILYELATGKPANEQETREKVLDAVKAGGRARPRRLAPEIPAGLEKIILTAIALNPDRRFQTVRSFAADLDLFLDGLPVKARPPGIAVQAVERCGRSPAWTAALLLSLLLIVTVVWVFFLPDAGPTRQDLDSARVLADSGIGRWLDGDRNAAWEDLGEALAVDPGNRTALFLLNHREKRATARQLAAAAARDPDSTLAAALRAGSALDAGDYGLAEGDLVLLARSLPGSHWVAENLGKVLLKQGKAGAAEKELLRAVDIDPDVARTWGILSEAHMARRNSEAGILAAERALALGGGGDDDGNVRTRLALATHLVNAGRHERARRILTKLIAEDRRNAQAWFSLGLSLDSDHIIVEAEQAYLQALGINPKNTSAMVCLANLYSGADRGKCRGCDRAYREHPEFLDFQKTEKYLRDALTAGRARNEGVTSSALAIALRLPDRNRIIGLLESLTGGKEKTPAILNLEHLLRRLRLAERDR
jgi:tetratricopeptide (TPR) repeat protein